MRASRSAARSVIVVCPIALLWSLGCSSGDGSELRTAPIDSAKVVTVDTFQPRHEVAVVALIPGRSCHRPQEPTVERSETAFRVTVQNLFTGAAVCTSDPGYRELTIALAGEFVSGSSTRCSSTMSRR